MTALFAINWRSIKCIQAMCTWHPRHEGCLPRRQCRHFGIMATPSVFLVVVLASLTHATPTFDPRADAEYAGMMSTFFACEILI